MRPWPRRSGAAFLIEGNLSPGVREDRANRTMFGAFAEIGRLSAYPPTYTDENDIWTLDGDGIH